MVIYFIFLPERVCRLTPMQGYSEGLSVACEVNCNANIGKPSTSLTPSCELFLRERGKFLGWDNLCQGLK